MREIPEHVGHLLVGGAEKVVCGPPMQFQPNVDLTQLPMKKHVLLPAGKVLTEKVVEAMLVEAKSNASKWGNDEAPTKDRGRDNASRQVAYCADAAGKPKHSIAFGVIGVLRWRCCFWLFT